MASPKRIGTLTIGQSPRPDLVAPLQQMIPNYQLVQAGALDNLTVDDLPAVSGGGYPLLTRLDSGKLVKVEERFLRPHLQSKLDELESQGVAATFLLCAGTFADLKGRRPLFKPFDIACATLRALGMPQLGVICPIEEQQPAIAQRWARAGFRATVWTASVEETYTDLEHLRHKSNSCEAIVLDYVGHPLEPVLHLQRAVDIPVIDLGYLAMSVMVSTLHS